MEDLEDQDKLLTEEEIKYLIDKKGKIVKRRKNYLIIEGLKLESFSTE